MSEWDEKSNRETVKTLLAMGFIPTWLEELLEEGDKIQSQNQKALKYIQEWCDDCLKEPFWCPSCVYNMTKEELGAPKISHGEQPINDKVKTK